ncbi:MAG: DUF1294 domain-containing protein [Defluviitaleaceae bacterium]|nr:DUF1294 domain-containing protein [Defluviitaleaceae bacterium]
MNWVLCIVLVLIAWNIVTFSLYGIDKNRAKKRKWRIRESTLILCAFLMGGVGALAGMGFFRHKTKHVKFRILVPLAVAVNIGIAVIAWKIVR